MPRALPLLLLLAAACGTAERLTAPAAAPALPAAALTADTTWTRTPLCRWTSYWDGQRITHTVVCPDSAGRW